MTTPRLHPLTPGATIPGDWYAGTIPHNIEVGENTVIDSTSCFKHYFAKGNVGLRVGRDVTLWRASLSIGEHAEVRIGDGCYLAGASIACHERVEIGNNVVLAGGATVVDSDFHPVPLADRIADTIALSPASEPTKRPPVAASPVVIEDDVWVGYNATILKGVRIGAGAVIAPGAVVSKDVPANARVAGNPARPVEVTQ